MTPERRNRNIQGHRCANPRLGLERERGIPDAQRSNVRGDRHAFRETVFACGPHPIAEDLASPSVRAVIDQRSGEDEQREQNSDWKSLFVIGGMPHVHTPGF